MQDKNTPWGNRAGLVAFVSIGAACLWIHDNLEPAFLNGHPHNALWTLGLILVWLLACSFVVMRANTLWERRHLND